ncbi:MAG: hypothetical protein K0R27_2805 [Xanthobacteraceae bacterium]|jgi:hypothetical protein|nr:hypothetical protein [Xanthobacteraceae bacterium]
MAMSPEEFAVAVSPVFVTTVVTVAGGVVAGSFSDSYLKFVRWLPLIAMIQPLLLAAFHGGLPYYLGYLVPIVLLSLVEGLVSGTAAFLVALAVRRMRPKRRRAA